MQTVQLVQDSVENAGLYFLEPSNREEWRIQSGSYAIQDHLHTPNNQSEPALWHVPKTDANPYTKFIRNIETDSNWRT